MTPSGRQVPTSRPTRTVGPENSAQTASPSWWYSPTVDAPSPTGRNRRPSYPRSPRSAVIGSAPVDRAQLVADLEHLPPEHGVEHDRRAHREQGEVRVGQPL